MVDGVLEAVVDAAGAGTTTPVSELQGGPRGRVLVAVIFANNAAPLTPNASTIGLQMFFGTYPGGTPGGGGTTDSTAGTDSNGDIGTSTTIVFDSDGKHFDVVGGDSAVPCPTGFWGMSIRVSINFPGVQANIIVQIQSYTPDDFPGTSPPNPPTAPTADVNTDPKGGVKVRWTDNSTDENGFFIERATDGGAFELIGDTPANIAEFDDYAADPTLHSYDYRISSFKDNGVSTTAAVHIGGATPCDKSLPWTLSMSPSNGPTIGGTLVTINGVDTTAVNPATSNPYLLRVSIGTKRVIPTIIDADTLTFLTPESGAGAFDVAVFRPETGEVAVAPTQFTYIANLPPVTSVIANVGPVTGGTVVTIHGTGFVAGSSVTFGELPSPSVTLVSSTEITAVAPAHPPGTVVVRVIAP